MVFCKNFVASIKWNGKICRESIKNGDSTIYIPFGSEYSIVLKNLNTKKAMANVEIDGRMAINGLIIDTNKSVELERFFENDLNSGHKFKFIEKTDDIRNYRGDKIEDGIIRITYQFEKESQFVTWYNANYYNYNSVDFCYNPYQYRTYISSTNINNNNCPNESVAVACASCCNEDGITVEGSKSNQSFSYGEIGILEDTEHCINIQLKGVFPTKGKVKDTLIVNKKLQCGYCGRKYNSNFKYCSNCGATLI